MKKAALILALGAFSVLMALGCSDDKKTTTSTTELAPLDMVDIGAVIAQAAPPEFTAPSTSPAAVDSIWNAGSQPLLEVVFGANEPQALYRNINEFELKLAILQNTLLTDGDGNIATGTYVDSAAVNDMMMHYTATVTALSSPTAVPTDAQWMFGETVDVGYLVEIAVEEEPASTIKLGVTLNSTEETIFEYSYSTEENDKTTSLLNYASLDPTDSSFAFKGIRYVHYGDDEVFNCAFNIGSASTADFSYRMAWVSNPPDSTEFLYCLVGGGNRDVEFALKFCMLSPITATEPDPEGIYDQVFGPNYSEGSGLISAYSEYLNDNLLFSGQDMPTAHLTDPWATE